MSIVQFNFPTVIRFGAGARSEISAAIRGRGASRPLVVTDSGIARLPVFEQFMANLKDPALEVAVFSDFAGNPVESQVTRGVEAYKAHGADLIIGFGGGAALDVAKAIALMAHHPGRLFDYEDEKPGALPIDQHIPPIIGVPTTAGTGSEVGRSTVISTDDTHAKKIMFSPRLLPALVLADPELLLSLPPNLTATTGADALTHNIEAYLARGWHPMADGIAREGVRLCARALEKSVRDGSDLQARSDMLMASIMGAVAFQKGLGVTHSLAHALSTVLDLHHGLANGLMLPHAMRFNAKAVPERLGDLASDVGVGDTAAAFIDWLSQLQLRIGLPRKLSEVGVTADHIDALADIAIADACHPNNPRPCTREDMVTMYQEAL